MNRLTHSIGIPMIVVSLPLLFFDWRWALVTFIVGSIFNLWAMRSRNELPFSEDPFTSDWTTCGCCVGLPLFLVSTNRELSK